MLSATHTNTTLGVAHFASFYKGFGRQIMLLGAHTNTILGASPPAGPGAEYLFFSRSGRLGAC